MKLLIRCTWLIFLSFYTYSQEKYTDVSDLWDMIGSINDINEPKDKKGIKYIIKETTSLQSKDKKPFMRVVYRKYDEFGNLIYINKEREDEPLFTKRIFRNSMGKIDSICEYTYSDTGIFRSIGDNPEQSKSISYFDNKGRIELINRYLWKTSYEPINYRENVKFIYDEKSGQIKSKKVFETYSDGSGGLDHSDRYIYNDGLLLEKSFISDRQGGVVISRTIYGYYDDRSLKNVKNYSGREFLSDEYKFEYYPGGGLKKTFFSGISESVFEFDKDGKLIKHRSINPDYPERDYVENIIYDDELISQIIHMKGGKTTRTKVENFFDQYGRLSEVKIGKQLGLFDSSPRKREYSYDDQNRILQNRLSRLNSENKYEVTYIEKYHYIDY